jgi:hypothetical protein
MLIRKFKKLRRILEFDTLLICEDTNIKYYTDNLTGTCVCTTQNDKLQISGIAVAYHLMGPWAHFPTL